LLAVGDAIDASNRSRRALALLALAAAAGPDGIDRPGVLALLWPDSDTDRAANSFRQILHGIRRDLGEGAIIYEAGSLRLNPETFSVDLWEFEHAIRCDDMESAAAAYRGPFLGSFNISGLKELERWAETHRERLKQTALTAMRRLAAAASVDGRHQDNIRWCREIVDIDPLSSKNALGLLRALADAGERAGALDFARTYEALVRVELETEVDQEVGDYVLLLRRTSGPTGSVVMDAPTAHGAEAEALLTSGEPVATARVPDDATVDAPLQDDSSSSISDSLYKDHYTHKEPRIKTRGRVRWLALRLRPLAMRASLFAGALGLLGVLVAVSRLSRAVAAAEANALNVVAVLPFHSYDKADSSLGVTLAALLSADVDGAGPLRSVPTGTVLGAIGKLSNPRSDGPIDPREASRLAKKLGAGTFVMGDLVPRAHGMRLSLELRDVRSGAVIGNQIAVDTDSGHAKQVIDDLTGQLLAERYRQPGDQLVRAALRSTRSVAAAKSYLRGEAALREARYVDATNEFEHAVAADSMFALAYYRLAGAADWSGRDRKARSATDFAIRFSDKLGDRERRLIVAFATARDGRGTIAENAYRAILDDYPDDAESWFHLGELMFHNNPLRGESVTRARPVFERLLTLSPDNVEAIIHLARIASLEHRQSDADALQRRALKLVDTPGALEQRALRVFALADRPGIRRISRDLEKTAPKSLGGGSLLGVAIDVDDVFGSERFARGLIEESSSKASRAFGTRLLAYTWLAEGRCREARAQLDSAVALDKDLGIAELSLVATMPFVPMTRAELQQIYAMVQEWQPPPDVMSENEPFGDDTGRLRRLHQLGLISARLGDLTAARDAASQLEAISFPARTRRYAYTLAQSVRAHVSAEEGHLTEALAKLDGADWEAAAGTFAAEAGDRFFRASLLQRLNRSREAIDWYSSIAERAAYELPYLAPAQLRLAAIKRAAGDVAGAKAHADRAAELWQNADSAVRVVFR
jgi:DNA-binding SARP family transcriptional activator/tetratricopeptide (TPR) repeat protein